MAQPTQKFSTGNQIIDRALDTIADRIDEQILERELQISTEDVIARKYILITWNPKPREFGQIGRGGKTKTNYLKQWKEMLIKVLFYIRRVSNFFCILPELSLKGKLHCHGWLRLDDPIKWHKQVVHKLNANGSLAVVKMNSTNSLYYYRKDLRLTHNILPTLYIQVANDTVQEIKKQMILDQKEKLGQGQVNAFHYQYFKNKMDKHLFKEVEVDYSPGVYNGIKI